MLYYLSHGSFPSKKAHTIQMVRMCEAFAKTGTDTTLVHPSYGSGKLAFEEIASFYGVETHFEIKTIPSLSGKNNIPNVPTSGEILMSGWLISRLLGGKIKSGDIIFSRYVVPTWALLQARRIMPTKSNPTILFDQHKEFPDHPLVGDRFYNEIDGVVFTAENIRDRTISANDLSRDQTIVRPNGVNLGKYDTRSIEEARKEVGLPLDSDIVAYTGHLYPDKRVEELIKIAPDLDAEVYIVGGYEDDIARIKKQLPESAHVTFTGFVQPSIIATYQKAADVLVVTSDPDSRYYSQIKLFEYMAAEKPIVATRTPTFEEIMEHETHCLFADPDDKKDLYNKIARLLDDKVLSKALSTNARKLAEEFSWERRAEHIIEFAQSV